MRYKKITAVLDKELEFIVCEDCGLFVYDGEKHNEWHDNIARAIKNGDYAAVMMRPISGENHGYTQFDIGF